MSISWRDLLAKNSTVVLLSADVDHIQEYVFESARLPEIRGASMLVEDLNRQAADEMKKWLIYCGGGSLLAILPDQVTASQMKTKIERLFPAETGVVTTTCVLYETTVADLLNGYKAAEVTPENIWALRNPNHPADWQRITTIYRQDFSVKQEEFIKVIQQQFSRERHFGQTVKLMSILLRREKDQRQNPLFHETLPHAQRCRSCGQRPATWVGQYADNIELWPLCDPCGRKIESRKKKRTRWLEEAVSVFRKAPYFDKIQEDRVELANDLTDIGQGCETRPGYIAFIYADGDSIGQHMSLQKTPDDYEQASRALIKTTSNAIYQSLAQFLRPTQITRKSDKEGKDEKIFIHPFEIITIGGDDALLIVPADLALPIAVNISRQFTHQLGLPLSVGVVIASAHTPVRSLRDIAKQLLKSAKRRAKEASRVGNKEGGVDFLVLTSQSILRRDLDNLRNTYPIRLPGEGQGNSLRLTNAPYIISEVVILLDLLRQMRQANFPTSQLQQLTAALRDGRERGSLYFLYQQARLGGKPYGDVLKAIAEQWGFDPKSDPIPWQEVKMDPPDPKPEARYTSILPDLADLFSFVPTKGEIFERWSSIIEEAVYANSH